MPDNNHRFLGELRLGRTLISTSQVAAGGIVIWMALIILLSDPAVTLVGVKSPLAGLLATLALGLTLLSVIELLAGSSERGGAYFLVHGTIGGPGAFLTGWALLATNLALVAASLSVAAGILRKWIILPSLSQGTTALGLLAILVLLELFQIFPRRVNLRMLVLPLLFLVLVGFISTLPRINLDLFQTSSSLSLSAVNRTIALTSACFAAFEFLLISRQQIRQPVPMLSKAIWGTLLGGGLLFSFALFVLAGLNAPSLISGNIFTAGLVAVSLFPGWLVDMLALLTLMLATNALLMSATYQIHAFSLVGAFPKEFQRMWGPIPMPVSLFILLALLITPLVIFTPVKMLLEVAAAASIFTLVMLNLTAIYSRKVEPDRRRSLQLPLSPLIPALAAILNFVFFLALPRQTLITAVIWFSLGLIFYFLYARQNQMKAKAGDIVFGHTEVHTMETDRCRVLVPLGPGEERHLILGLSIEIAKQMGGEVIPLQVIAVPDPLSIEEGRRTAQERNFLFRRSLQMAEDQGVPVHPITRLARTVPEGIIDTAAEEHCDIILMSWPVNKKGPGTPIGTVLSQVARDAPCDVAVFAYRYTEIGDGTHRQKEAQEFLRSDIHKILVPTSGGPNAPLAIRLALMLARENDGSVSTVYVADKNATQEDLLLGKTRIANSIDTMRKQAEEIPEAVAGSIDFEEVPVEGEVIQANTVVEGLVETGKEYDLILLGATEESLIDRVLFGSIPEKVARDSISPVIIVKRYQGLPRLWLQRAWNTVFETFPTLEKEEQVEVYRGIHRGARPDVDFFIMIGLSALIATFGLLQSSTAVIIGAMLVAPLFSPLLALSLAIIQGNVRLLRVAIESSIKGIALAVVLAAILTFISPYKSLTPEITARTLPTLFDLVVALASGAAGAYAIARKDVAAALPGVAIAAALVPPLCVIGVGLAMGNLAVAGGSTLLFLTNLVSIALAGSITFLLLGFRPGAHARDVHLKRGLITTIVFFVIISIPLTILFSRTIQDTRNERLIRTTIRQTLEDYPGVELAGSADNISILWSSDSFNISLPVYTDPDIDVKIFANQIDQELEKALGYEVRLRVVTLPSVVTGSNP